MPLIFIGFGLFLMIAAVRGGDNLDNALNLLKGDFTGNNSFINWLVALFVLGAVGFIKPLRAVSVALMTLVIITLLLANNGFFAKFREQVQS